MKSKQVKTIASLKMPGIVAIGVLAVMLRAAAFTHNHAAYFAAVLLWLLGVIIFFIILKK
jgi:hypothetical protein